MKIMWEKIVAFFMAVVALFVGLLANRNNAPITALENRAYGTHTRQSLDLYLPAQTGDTALVVFIHGGAWVSGDKSAYTETVKTFCKDYNVAAATVNYRYLAADTSMEDLVEDIGAALMQIKQLAFEHGVILTKCMLGGHSAGGHLSMLYAYSRAKESPVPIAFVFNQSGPADLTDDGFFAADSAFDRRTVEQLLSWAVGSAVTLENKTELAAKIRDISPLYYVGTATVPTIICHGEKDSIVPYSNALALDAKLTAAGVKHDFVSYPNSGHDLSADPESAALANNLLYSYAKEFLF